MLTLFQGYKNDMKTAMDKVDQQYLNELSMGSENSAKNAYNVTVRDSGMVEDDMPVSVTEAYFQTYLWARYQ